MSTEFKDRLLNALALAPIGVVDAAVILVGIWQIYATFAVRSGLTFWGLLGGLVFPGAIALVLFAMTREGEGVPVTAASLPAPPRMVTLLTLGAAIGSILLWREYRNSWLQTIGWALPWAAVVFHLGLMAYRRPLSIRTSSRAQALDWAVIAGAIAIAITATLWIHRPEDDDAFYLNQVLATLRNPELAVLSFDGMHGDLAAPVQQLAHRAQTYELLVAVAVWATGLAASDVYYMGFPLGGAVLLPFATWAVARAMFGTGAGRFAVVICMGVMALWGGHYYCFGNFAFARLFQGKGQAVSIFLPLCVYYGMRFAERPTWQRWSMLMLAQSAAACFTSTALVVAPVAAALPVLAGVRFDRAGMKMAGAALLTALPVVAMLLLIQLEISSIGGLPGSHGHIRGLEVVLGANQRVVFALCALPVIPTLAAIVRAPQAAWLTRYVLVIFLFLMNDFTTGIFADLGGNLLSWRSYWAVPFPLMVAGVGGLGLAAGWRVQNKGVRIALVLGALAYLGGFYSAGRPSWASGNFAELKYGVWRVPEREHSAAQTAVVLSDEDSVVLLHPEPSQRITTFENHPTVVGVRRGYTRHLQRYYGASEAGSRNRLLRFAEADRKVLDLTWYMREFDKRCIDVFVTTTNATTTYPTLQEELERRSFVHFNHKGYGFWYRGDKWACDADLTPLPPGIDTDPKPKPKPKAKRRRRKKKKKKRN